MIIIVTGNGGKEKAGVGYEIKVFQRIMIIAPFLAKEYIIHPYGAQLYKC